MIRPRTVAVLAIVGAWLAATVVLGDALVQLLGPSWASMVAIPGAIPWLMLVGWTLDALPPEPAPEGGA